MSWLLDREIKRELPDDWKGLVPSTVFVEEAKRLVKSASEKNLILRIMGGLGIAVHADNEKAFGKRLKRVGAGKRVEGQEYSDIDLMGLRKQRDNVGKLFQDDNYVKRRTTLSSAASERQIYYHPKGWFYVDVFYDKLLVANHSLDFRDRLRLDYPTLTVTDLLLEKVQMWEAFGEKDLKDCLVLLKAHDVASGKEKECINSDYIAKILSNDWGFWYTATTNIRRIKNFILHLDDLSLKAGMTPSSLSAKERTEITEKIDAILLRVDKEPKSFGWKARGKIGIRKRWYNPVETERSTAGFGIWEALLPNK